MFHIIQNINFIYEDNISINTQFHDIDKLQNE